MQKDRSRIIGGSDIAAVMGLNRWKTPLALWAEKTGKVQTDLSNFEAAEIGTELEEYVARKFTRKSGIKVRRDSRTFRHGNYDYMVAHIDRWVVGEDALLECKTTSAWNAKEWAGEEIPQEYILQVMWYLGILGKRKGYIACLIGGQRFVWKEIDFDEDLFTRQVDAAKDFMENFVLKDRAPIAMAGDSDVLLQMFPESVENTIKFQGQDAEMLDNLIEERTGGIEVVKDAKKELEAIEAKIKQFLGEAEAGETESHRITWRTQTRPEHVVKAAIFRVLRCKKKG